MEVRDDVPWRHLTEEERNIVRMWHLIGLPFEANTPQGFCNVWVVGGPHGPDYYDGHWRYRLKKDEASS